MQFCFRNLYGLHKKFPNCEDNQILLIIVWNLFFRHQIFANLLCKRLIYAMEWRWDLFHLFLAPSSHISSNSIPFTLPIGLIRSFYEIAKVSRRRIKVPRCLLSHVETLAIFPEWIRLDILPVLFLNSQQVHYFDKKLKNAGIIHRFTEGDKYIYRNSKCSLNMYFSFKIIPLPNWLLTHVYIL